MPWPACYTRTRLKPISHWQKKRFGENSMIFWRRKTHETELDEELRTHLSMAAQTRMERGVDPEEAERAARGEFGNVGLVKEATRDAWGGRWLGDLLDDTRYGLRMLGKNPGFTAVAMLTLALGIGSNTAVFSLIDALLLRSLAVPAPRELVHISFGPPGTKGPLSGPMFDRLRERQSAFTDLFAWKNGPMVLTEKDAARPITGAYATGSAFPTLKLKPRLGRLLNWQDDEPDASSNGIAAVISEAFWIEHFGGDPRVLGQPITVDGGTATIVGVMPRSFNGITVDYAPQVVLPFAFDVALRGKSSCRFRASCWFHAMGRLKPGLGFAQARANLSTIAGDVLKESLPSNYERVDYLRKGILSLTPGRTGNSPLGEVYGRELWTLQALVGLLMIIWCANLASLERSRTLNRQHERAVAVDERAARRLYRAVGLSRVPRFAPRYGHSCRNHCSCHAHRDSYGSLAGAHPDARAHGRDVAFGSTANRCAQKASLCRKPAARSGCAFAPARVACAAFRHQHGKASPHGPRLSGQGYNPIRRRFRASSRKKRSAARLASPDA